MLAISDRGVEVTQWKSEVRLTPVKSTGWRERPLRLRRTTRAGRTKRVAICQILLSSSLQSSSLTSPAPGIESRPSSVWVDWRTKRLNWTGQPFCVDFNDQHVGWGIYLDEYLGRYLPSIVRPGRHDLCLAPRCIIALNKNYKDRGHSFSGGTTAEEAEVMEVLFWRIFIFIFLGVRLH